MRFPKPAIDLCGGFCYTATNALMKGDFMVKSSLLSDLVQPSHPQTTLEVYAQQVADTEQRFGAVFPNNSKLSVTDAFYHIGGNEIVLDIVPLVGVDPQDNSKIILEADKIREKVVRQNAPFESFLGTVKSKGGILPHSDFIEALNKVAVRNGKPLPPTAIAITRDGKKIAVQFPLDTFDVAGDVIRQHVMFYSSVIRSAGSGIMLWDMVMRCSNQIPVMRMGKGDKNIVSIGGRSPLRIETMMGSLGDFMLNAQTQMREAYDKMVKTPINQNMMDIMLSKLYSVPDIPKTKVHETLDEKMKIMNAWSAVYNQALKDRSAVQEIFSNGNGTHNTIAINGNLYGFLQAVTELETKRPFKDAAVPLNQYLGGNSGRGKKSIEAFEMCYDQAVRNIKAVSRISKVRDMV